MYTALANYFHQAQLSASNTQVSNIVSADGSWKLTGKFVIEYFIKFNEILFDDK